MNFKILFSLLVIIFIMAMIGCSSPSKSNGSSENTGAGNNLINQGTVSFAALPSKANVLTTMQLVDTYFINKYPSPGANADSSHPGNIWTKATYLNGKMALYNTNNSSTYMTYMTGYGSAFTWNTRSGNKTQDADDQTCLQIYEELYLKDTTQTTRLTNAKTCADNMCSVSAINQWSWIDAIHMAAPVLAKMGTIENNTKYANKMYQCWNWAKATSGFYDTSKHLWWRDATFKGGSIYWSRGNTWVFAALARIMAVLPTSDSHRAEYIQVF